MNERMNVECMFFSIICPLALVSILRELGIPAVCLPSTDFQLCLSSMGCNETHLSGPLNEEVVAQRGGRAGGGSSLWTVVATASGF